MYLGEIVEIGPRAEVIVAPRHPYTRRLMSAVPDPDPVENRHRTIGMPATELPSPIRPLGYVPPERSYRSVGPGHLVAE
jgi:peptide/nickel transport system ATP-binding protein